MRNSLRLRNVRIRSTNYHTPILYSIDRNTGSLASQRINNALFIQYAVFVSERLVGVPHYTELPSPEE